MKTQITALAVLALASTIAVTGSASSSAAGRDGGAASSTRSTSADHRSERRPDQRPGCRLPGPYGYPQGSERVHLRPRDFTTRIDNPYWPMRPGTTWKYVEKDDEETQQITVRVTHRTRTIQGIRARVVRDTVRMNGELVEDTRDWYAQDSGGSIWYLGEATEEFEDGKVVSTEGSWEYGRRGAQAGIIVPAAPRAGCAYREEYLRGEAEDVALVLSRTESMQTPTGFHRRVLHTANTTPLHPDILENKFYARGVGPVLEIGISPSFGRAELVELNRP